MQQLLPQPLLPIKKLLICFLIIGNVLLGLGNVWAQPKPVISVKSKNQLSTDWLVYQAETNRLISFLPDEHAEVRALSQWITFRKGQPFPIAFTAKADLCIFIDNRLIFSADSAATYNLDLAALFKPGNYKKKYLLTVWHPSGQPSYGSFVNTNEKQVASAAPVKSKLRTIPRNVPNQNAFIIGLLVIGLIYGSLKTNFTSDFNSIFRISTFMRSSALEEGFLAKPVSSVSSILFVIAFSLSFGLLIVAIHTEVQNILIFNRLFAVSDRDIISKVVFYSMVVFGFIIFKFVFLKVMGYIFDLGPLVNIQYREFIRTLLFLGIFLPVIMLLYLAFNQARPGTVLLISNLAVSIILVVTSFRIFYTVNKKVPLRNLHLISYLCATEVIPLAIILNLVVFNYRLAGF